MANLLEINDAVLSFDGSKDLIFNTLAELIQSLSPFQSIWLDCGSTEVVGLPRDLAVTVFEKGLIIWNSDDRCSQQDGVPAQRWRGTENETGEWGLRNVSVTPMAGPSSGGPNQVLLSVTKLTQVEPSLAA